MTTRYNTTPGVEFEGPMGYFWPLEEVPAESLFAAITEFFEELERRGYSEEQMTEMFLEVLEKRAQ